MSDTIHRVADFTQISTVLNAASSASTVLTAQAAASQVLLDSVTAEKTRLAALNDNLNGLGLFSLGVDANGVMTVTTPTPGRITTQNTVYPNLGITVPEIVVTGAPTGTAALPDSHTIPTTGLLASLSTAVGNITAQGVAAQAAAIQAVAAAGRVSVDTVAAIPDSVTALCVVTTGSQAGQVWQRPAVGIAPVRQLGAEIVSQAQLVGLQSAFTTTQAQASAAAATASTTTATLVTTQAGLTTAQAQIVSTQAALVQLSSSVGNTTLAQLSTKPQSAGAQFFGGSRWLWFAGGTPDGGTTVPAKDAGFWVRELVNGSISPEMFGAVGDGVADDKAAIWALCAAYRAGTGSRIVLSRPYRVGAGTTAAHAVGAIEFIGVPRVYIEFVGKGQLLMDNLGADGGGHEYGGIYIAGPCDDVRIDHPNIEWKVRPGPLTANGFTFRSQGDGIMVRGYPSDTGAYENTGAVKKCVVDTPHIKWAPQTGMIFMGVSDPLVINATIIETGADSCHFNACRRPRVTGGIQAIGCGDDALPFVTYYGPDRTPIYPGTGVQLYRTPWFIHSQTDEWSNGGGYADKVECRGGATNACRMDAAYNVTVDVVHAINTPFGLQIDSAIADGVTYIWNAAASRGCRIGRVITDNVNSPVLVIIQNVNKATPGNDAYYNMDVEIGSVQTTGTTGPQAVWVSGAENVRIGTINTDGDVLFNAGARNILTQTMTCRQLTMDTAADVNVRLVNARNIIITSTKNITGSLWVSKNAPDTAIYLAAVSGLQLDRINIVMPNRSNVAGARAFLFAAVQTSRISAITIDTDATQLNWAEFGGGGPDRILNDLEIGSVILRHTRATNTPNTALQGGPYAPKNYRYDLKCNNGGAWVTEAANTYA